MRKIILNLAVSLDGYIEGPKGEFDWCFTDQDYGMKKFLSGIDSIFYGRKSYELMISFEEEYFSEKKKFVFSKSLTQVKDGYQLVNEDIQSFVNTFRSTKGLDGWMFGGKELFNGFLKFGLIDELLLSIHPIILGGGKTLFDQIDHRIPLNLIETKSYDTGLVQLKYEVN